MKAPHPFPARMAPELALASVGRLEAGPVLDPMCGSGMVLKAAMSEGHDVIGFDLDPLAVLMSKVWTSRPPADLEWSAAKLLRSSHSAKRSDLSWIDGDPETARFIDYWFARPQQEDLRRVAFALAQLPEDETSNALRLALSRTIVAKSVGASLASDVSHSRPHRTRTTNDYDVFAGFLLAARNIGKALAHGERGGQSSRVEQGDARRLDRVESDSIGMVVTSPPYLNAIDYLRGHRLALVWLGHTIPDLRRVRAASIGAERRAETAPEDQSLRAIAEELQIDSFAPRLRGMLERYLIDLDGLAGEIARVLRPGAEAVLVVGNSTIRGEFVDNAQFAVSTAVGRGLTLLERSERELPENRRYLPPPRRTEPSEMAKRMRTEVVIRLQKTIAAA